MSTRLVLLLLALAGLVLLGWRFYHTNHPDSELAARQKLDALLEPEQPLASPLGPSPLAPKTIPPADPGVPDPFAGPESFFGFHIPMPKATVQLQETSDAYELRVPLADPKDASSIRLNVEPHRIEISGQSGSRDGNASVSSSFMQAFSTSQEVLPDQIRRRTERKGKNTELVITIPKKMPGHAPQPAQSQSTKQPEKDLPEIYPDSPGHQVI